MAISLGVKIWGDIDPLLTALARAEKDMKKFARQAENMGKTMTQSLTLPIVGFGVLAVKNFADAEKASASLASQIRANGKDVDSTMKRYGDFAAEMQRLTTVEDDAAMGFLQLAESMQAPDAEKAVKDAIGLSKAFGVEMPQAVKMAVQAQNGQYTMLGKLNPAIKAAKDNADKAAIAQKMFADSFIVATAQAKVGLGPFEQLKNQIGNLTESYGKLIAQALLPIVEKIKAVATWLDSLSESQRKWIVGISLTVAAAGPLILAVGKITQTLALLTGGIGGFVGAMRTASAFLAANPWLVLAAGIAAVATALYVHATRATAAETAQRSYNSIVAESIKQSASERSEVGRLYEVAKNETESKANRLLAVKKLNDISPKYLKGLSLETIGTDQARLAVEGYTKSLVAKSKVQIATERLAQLAIKKEEILAGVSKDIEPDVWQKMTSAMAGMGSALGGAAMEAVNLGSNQKDAISAISKETEMLNKIISDNKDLIDENAKKTVWLGTTAGTTATATVKLKDEIAKLEEQLRSEIIAKKSSATATAALLARKKGYLAELENEIRLMQQIQSMPARKQQTVEIKATLQRPENVQAAIREYSDSIAALEVEVAQLQKAYDAEVASTNTDYTALDRMNTAREEAIAKIKSQKEALQALSVPSGPAALIPIAGQSAPATLSPVANPKPIDVDTTSAVDSIEQIGEVLDSISGDKLGNFFTSAKSALSGFASFAKQAATGFKEGFASAFMAVAQVASGVVSAITDIMSQSTDRRIAENDAYYEREKSNIENSYMSQEQKTRALERLDKNYEKKRKELMRQQAKDQKAAAIMQAVISGAVAVVTALTAGPIIGVVLAAVVGALAAAQIALIAAQPLPALAEGGLAMAPTMAVVGDNPNARIDPEVISPLSKLKGMMRGSQDVTVYGVLKGSDIYLSSEKGGLKLARVRGY